MASCSCVTASLPYLDVSVENSRFKYLNCFFGTCGKQFFLEILDQKDLPNQDGSSWILFPVNEFNTETRLRTKRSLYISAIDLQILMNDQIGLDKKAFLDHVTKDILIAKFAEWILAQPQSYFQIEKANRFKLMFPSERFSDLLYIISYIEKIKTHVLSRKPFKQLYKISKEISKSKSPKKGHCHRRYSLYLKIDSEAKRCFFFIHFGKKYLINRGSFKNVTFCLEYETEQVKVLAKSLLKDNLTQRCAKTEVLISSAFPHSSHLMQSSLFAFLPLYQPRKQYMIIDYMNKRDLRLQLPSLNLQDRFLIAEHILRSIVILHQAHIAHRDLKPENIFLSIFLEGDQKKMQVKLGDFGFAKIEGEDPQNIQGTFKYLSPEILFLNEGKNQTLTNEIIYASDMWAIGIIFYEIFFQSFPFTDSFKHYSSFQNLANLIEGIRNTLLSFQTHFQTPIEKLILKMLTLDTKQRILSLPALQEFIQLSQKE